MLKRPSMSPVVLTPFRRFVASCAVLAVGAAAIAVAQAAQVNPVPPALAACLGASLAFMLPVSTPPNAIVFGTGCVPLLKMVRHGLVLDLFGIVAIILTVHWLVPLFV